MGSFNFNINDCKSSDPLLPAYNPLCSQGDDSLHSSFYYVTYQLNKFEMC